MQPLPSNAEPPATPGPLPRRTTLHRWLAALLAGAAVAALPALPLPADALALAQGLLAAAALLWASRKAQQRPAEAPMSNESTPYPLVLTRQVLPVWRRNVEAARGHSDTAMTALLERFASVSAQLDVALSNSRGATVEHGAEDQLLARHQPEVQQLLATTHEAVAQRDAALAAARALTEELDALQAQAREVQAIGRATHLLALNASVEATRAGAAGNGGNGSGNAFAVVAQQVRHLADQSRQAGTRIAQRVQAMGQRLDDAAAPARRSDTSPDELQLRAQDSARKLVRALVGGLAEVSRSSRTLRDAGRQIQADIDDILVSLQSQDRLSQMLSSVTGDMQRLEALQAGQDDPEGDTVVKWLERLDASYTMEEMRSSHHGAVRIEQSASVEFF